MRFARDSLLTCVLTGAAKLGSEVSKLNEFFEPLRWGQFQVLSQQTSIDVAHVVLDSSNVHRSTSYHAHLPAQNIQRIRAALECGQFSRSGG
jgi:hypothetical protein